MARGTTFLDLVIQVRGETLRSVSPAVGVDDIPVIKQKINRVYQTVYDEYDWPHLMRFLPRQNLAAGQRYYDVPNTTTYEEIREVVAWWSNKPHTLTRGIGFEHYGAFDPENNERSDPALRYEIRFTGTKEQIEIWPLPASAYPFQIAAKRKFAPLVADGDLCFVDDQTVVMLAASELHPDKDERRRLLAFGQDRLAQQKANSKTDSEPVRLGMGTRPREIPHQVVIRVGRD